MIYYNVTINIDQTVEQTWLSWMQNKHIAEVLATGLFQQARMVKIKTDQADGSTSYAVQYTADSMDDLDQYYREHAPRLREEGLQLFGDKMLAFRTELEHISDHYPQK
ncbi:MAG: hypothetical protein CFE24_11350 [Flavobacterium sp. BFFFF2]|nr:MAG: hypothetical protein CFE24_11350 [Flavobacterium sp. BFFFF2]